MAEWLDQDDFTAEDGVRLSVVVNPSSVFKLLWGNNANFSWIIFLMYNLPYK